jgi:hypothetical protein
MALPIGLSLLTIAGLGALIGKHVPVPNLTASMFPANSARLLEPGAPDPRPEEKRSMLSLDFSSAPARRAIPSEPISTASISPAPAVPATVVVGSLRPQQPLIPIAITEQPTAKTPEESVAHTAPVSRPRPAISAAEAAAYLTRAETALRNGDVVGARSLFGHLAQAGDPRGALGMARTYDEAEFKKLPVYGLKPDNGEAERWRARALDMASAVTRN